MSPASSDHDPPAAVKACHSCRRRRLRCDGLRPHCNKCLVAGRECLGYGKLLRWTGAVASRGKLAGRPSSAPDSALSPPSSTSIKSTKSVSASSSSSSSPPSSSSSTTTITSSSQPLNSSATQNLLHHRPPLDPHNNPSCRSGPMSDHGDVTAFTAAVVRRPWVLTDPLFQDMAHPYRRYLNYFARRLCQDLVSQDLPGRNPFRSLIPMTRDHPLLLHVIVAAAASHTSNLVKAPLMESAAKVDSLSRAQIQEAAQSSFRDALVAKHKALTLMRCSLENPRPMEGHVLLAAALFFVNVELIESGKNAWRAHLQGAGRIISLLQPAASADEDVLRDYVLSDIVIYYILGSAFMPSASSDFDLYLSSCDIPAILDKAAANSYLCCPPEILSIIYAAARLSNSMGSGQSESAAASAGLELLRRAQAFDINEWAYDLRTISYLQHGPVESRIHVGMAHQLAACLYIMQAVPSLNLMADHEDFAEALSCDILAHLARVPDDDANFKATPWPTFIAGAQTKRRERREWVVDRLRRLAVACPWGFISSTLETLQTIWGLDVQAPGSQSWVQALQGSNLSILIV